MAEARQHQDNSGGWISIPSIPAHRVAQGVLAFLTAVIIATAVDAALITYNQSPGRWLLTAELVFDDGGSIVGWALAATWPLMEVFRMVLAGIYERRRREKALAEGFAAGEARTKAAIEEGIATIEEVIGTGRGESNADGREDGVFDSIGSRLRAIIEEGREKALAEGIAIGEARAQEAAAGSGASDTEASRPVQWVAMETQQRWVAWNLRRVQAKANGDDFAEEPPAGAALAAAGNLCVETHRLWLGWNIRRLEAETRGVDFAEPPPGIGGGGNSNADTDAGGNAGTGD